MKLKYVGKHGRKRAVGAIIVGVFLLIPFIATLVLNLDNIGAALRDGTWMVSALLLVGMLVCVYLYLRPTCYLRLNPETRTATFIDGKYQHDFTFAALGPIRIRTTIPPGDRSARHYVVESDAVPVVFYVDSLRDPAIKKARELCKFLGVQGEIVAGVRPGMAIDE